MLNPKSGLYEIYTAALMNEREFPHQSSGMFRPSEASATIQAPYGPKVLGACKRRTWYRLKGIPAKGETLPYQIQRMNVGKQVENAFIETCKRAGVYVANNVKFRAEMKGIPIAGEMDAVLRTTPCGKEKYVAECCTPGTLITTDDGRLIPIETIKSGTTILSGTGVSDVSQALQKRTIDEEIFKFKHKCDALSPLLTGEHPVMVAAVGETCPWDGRKQTRRTYEVVGTSWKKAREVVRGDYLCIPKILFGEERDAFRFDEIVENSDHPYEIRDGMVHYLDPRARINGIPIPSSVTADEEFFWILGLYAAEGSCTERAVYFSLHQEERSLIEKIQLFFRERFRLEAKVDNLSSKGVNIRISSTFLAMLFKSIMPGNSVSRTKRLRDTRLIPKSKVQDFLSGAIAGDGHEAFGKSRDGTNVVQVLQSVAPELAYLYFQMAAHLGQEPCFKKAKQGEKALGPKDNTIYRISWSVYKTKGNTGKLIDGGKFWAVKVKDVTRHDYTGPVYNFGADRTSAYTAGGISVHNCKSIYGYYPQKEILGKFIGTGREDGRPRDSYVMQIALYLYQFSRLPEDDPSYLPFGAIFVADRGDGHYGAFDVWLEKELKILGEDEVQSVHNIYYSSSSMGIYRTKIPYTVEDILNSYRAIQVALAIDKPLPRDFIREYNREQIEERHAAGEISANNYKKWMSSHGPRGKGKEKLGDFHCYKLYCGWSDYCWSCEN